MTVSVEEMPVSRTGRSRETIPSPSRAPQGGIPWDEVDACFRQFREAAVRLVERVNDLLGDTGRDPMVVQADTRRVRSVFGKWSADILVTLHSAPTFGFEELRRSLPGISPRVLSLKLKSLEDEGLIRREILSSRPPRVSYTLTDRGWTVAWLADPVLLYLRQMALRLDPPREREDPSPVS